MILRNEISKSISAARNRAALPFCLYCAIRATLPQWQRSGLREKMLRSGNPNPILPPAQYRFQPGQSGNPGGSTKGSRRRLTGAFLNDLASDYEIHGKAALVKLREDNPQAYIAAIVKLCPKELEVTNALDDLDNDALRIVLAAAQRYVARQKAQAIDLVPSAVDIPAKPE